MFSLRNANTRLCMGHITARFVEPVISSRLRKINENDTLLGNVNNWNTSDCTGVFAFLSIPIEFTSGKDSHVS